MLRILLPRSRDLSNLRWSVESLCNSRYHGITEKVVCCHSVGSLVLLWLLDHPDLQVINSATSRRWFVRPRKSLSRYKQRLRRRKGPIGSTSQNFIFHEPTDQYLVVTDSDRCKKPCRSLSLETFSNKSAWCCFGCDPKFGNYVGASPSSSIPHHAFVYVQLRHETAMQYRPIEPQRECVKDPVRR